ncbi:MAG TPA: biopolymer transporter ExbD [Burkholderiaceae bacterium]|nr:biopolymer transporter ExbD [Burkholderiaceae bacterium]
MSFGRLLTRNHVKPMSDINMTPLIDVMLVLVVIFIITAPLMTSAIKLDLPKSNATSSVDSPKFVTVVIDQSGQVYLNDQATSLTQLAQSLRQVAMVKSDTEVQLRADEAVVYGKVAEVMGVTQKAGLSRIGFITQNKQEAVK